MDDTSKNKVEDITKALEWPDSSLYEVVGPHSQCRWTKQLRTCERMCSAVRLTNQAARHYDARPRTLPFSRKQLEKLITEDLSKLEGHYWSVIWATSHRSHVDVRYNDDYRGVLVFNTMEFMIRPLRELREDDNDQPQRLHIYALDLKEILTLALQTDPDLGEQTTMAIGLASAKNPDTLKGKNMPHVAFEWRIDLAQKSTVERLVTKWRGSGTGGSVSAYRTIKKNYDKQRKKDDLIRAAALVEASMLSQPDELLRSDVPETQRAQPSPAALLEGTPQTRKRSNFALGDDTVPGPSRKRLSIVSQSARDFRVGAESQSGTSSAGLLRPPPPTDVGNPSARPPVQRSSHTRTEISQRPGNFSSTI